MPIGMSAIPVASRTLPGPMPLTTCARSVLSVVTAPVVYALTIPLALLDLFVTGYQRICFPVYGVAVVPRSRYFRFDRSRLPYLNALEKANCAFCSYAN